MTFVTSRLRRGAGWIWTDERQRNNVCVIGSEFVRILFPGRPVIGNRLLINGVPFQVIGIIQRIGHGNNADQNLRLIMPFSTMATYCPSILSVSTNQIACKDTGTSRDGRFFGSK